MTATARSAKSAASPNAPLPAPASPELHLKMLRQMLLIRRFEEKAAEAYALGKIGGFCHLYIGQEAVAVGALAALKQDDYVICSYREHGQALIKGISSRAVMAELFGKATGCSKGKGGSMHLFDAAKGFMGGHGIVGGHIPLGAGLAFASKYLGSDKVCVCFFGEAVHGRAWDRRRPRSPRRGDRLRDQVSRRRPGVPVLLRGGGRQHRRVS